MRGGGGEQGSTLYFWAYTGSLVGAGVLCFFVLFGFWVFGDTGEHGVGRSVLVVVRELCVWPRVRGCFLCRFFLV